MPILCSTPLHPLRADGGSLWPKNKEVETIILLKKLVGSLGCYPLTHAGIQVGKNNGARCPNAIHNTGTATHPGAIALIQAFSEGLELFRLGSHAGAGLRQHYAFLGRAAKHKTGQ